MVYNVIMEISPEKIKELVKKHYDIGNSESVMEIYTECGFQALMLEFAVNVMWEHIIQYASQFPELSEEQQVKFRKEAADIIKSNMDMGDNDPIVNEVENYNGWAEMDVDNFMADIENFVDSDTIPDPPPRHNERIAAEPETEPDDLDDVWKSGPDQVWDCDDKNPVTTKEAKDPEPVKWDGGW